MVPGRKLPASKFNSLKSANFFPLVPVKKGNPILLFHYLPKTFNYSPVCVIFRSGSFVTHWFFYEFLSQILAQILGVSNTCYVV